ncbi:hypothetical protein [Bilophila wadsworthia]|uniref:hypothetical protein n=1 Tax=Bilophila wadsworthia TaxID=35833 RepID=UPI001DB02DF1|nr:hypothetical protein [Bilophila wadsworthia]MBS5376642.1 hypothetical protein [Bilophila wadsworthia]MDU4377601.1 hypothetical protein [Bilophila wadsworthia]
METYLHDEQGNPICQFFDNQSDEAPKPGVVPVEPPRNRRQGHDHGKALEHW